MITAQSSPQTASLSATSSSQQTPPRYVLIIIVLAFVSVVLSTMQLLITPILSVLDDTLSTSPANAAWAVTITPLVSAVCVTIIGRLGDMFGKKRMMLVTVGVTALGLVVSALAMSLPMMLVGRGLQGVALGIAPLGVSLLRDILPSERVGFATAVMAASSGLGNALGMPLASGVAQLAGWHAMFAVFAALAVIGLILVAYVVPRGQIHHAAGEKKYGRFDWVGALLIAAALVCFLLPISKGAEWGWGSPLVIGLFVAAVVIAVVWVLAELHNPQPMVDLHTLAHPSVAWTDIVSVLSMFAMYAQFLVLPRILELPVGTGYGLGQSMFMATLWYAPGGFMALIMTPLTVRLARRFSPRNVLISACVFVAAVYLVAVPLIATTWGVLGTAILLNIGIGLAFGVRPVLLMLDVPKAQTAAVNGFNMVASGIGASTAGAVFGAVITTNMVSYHGEMMASLGGFHTSLLIASGVALVAGLCALFIPRHSKESSKDFYVAKK
jgi:predicted MFS family arabinose efflux permease